MLLLLIAAAAAGGSSDDSDGSADEDRQEHSETTSEPERTTTTEPRTTTTAAPTTTTIPPPRVYEGTGDFIIQDLEWPVDERLALATITHQGTSNFAVWGLDDGLQQNGLYVNTIGSYTGTILFGSESFGSDTTGMQIQADGPWRVEIKSPLLARRFNGPVSGAGDDVIYYEGQATPVAVSNSGSSNFVVYANDDLLVNEIGPYQGVIALPSRSIVRVTAEGQWSITPQ